MKFAFVFPGQGSQSLNMMAAYGDHPVIKATFDEASQVLGRDLWTLVTEGPVEAMNQTVNTQPLMLTADVAVWRLWKALGGAQPAMMAGHSLGEYAALVAAEAMQFSDAVPLVALRAEAMQAAVPEGIGAMAAILGLDAAIVQAVCRETEQAGQVVEAVNFNSPEQTVIAGHQAAVAQAAETCKAKGAKRAILLPVSAPSHCRLMQPAAEKLAGFLATIPMTAPKIPVVNNVDVVCAESAEDIRAALVRQVASPVRWVETQRALERGGVTHVFECGPGKV
ncbi:MAG: ACP S-malonyltransferase, partial [Rhodocyclaceae bacterium]|nr:ACP S-malonyltransferase [Rhodocyclaceae bacterium]